MKKIIWIVVGIIILIILFFMVFRPGGEDSWMKNEKGEYVEHGVPADVPDYVSVQQQAVIQAMQLYQEKKSGGMEFSSQCLGTVGGEVKYVVDIVHIPRSEQDNLPENQCQDYREKRVSHFIELDWEGNIVRVV